MPEFPIEISFRNIDHSEFVETDVRDKIAGLERFYDRILYCRVMVEAVHRHHHKGNLYDVHIILGVAGLEQAQGGSRVHLRTGEVAPQNL